MSEIVHHTLREQVVTMLRKRILSGKIKPGERIKELDISKEFNISRGPVREALRQIEQEGLITYKSNKGCTVKVLNYNDVSEIYLIRVTLEKLSVKIVGGKFSEKTINMLDDAVKKIGDAARKNDLYEIIDADEKFHRIITSEAKSQRLIDAWKLYEGENAAIYFTMNEVKKMPTQYLETNHKIIVDAIKKGDEKEICQVINEHYMVVPKDLYKTIHCDKI